MENSYRQDCDRITKRRKDLNSIFAPSFVPKAEWSYWLAGSESLVEVPETRIERCAV